MSDQSPIPPGFWKAGQVSNSENAMVVVGQDGKWETNHILSDDSYAICQRPCKSSHCKICI